MSDSTAADLAASSASTASTSSETGNRGSLLNISTPITTTILAGIVTLAGTIIGTFVQSHQTLALEREKEQHELILKMVSVGDLKQAQGNILWLAESGLITDADQAKKILAAKATPVLPQPSFNFAMGKPNGAPCGPHKGMVVMDGQCVFGGDGAVTK